ncbi:MAG: DarT ssDNA thymidine ADP-ribosyltransferase family protein, partial [Aquaticitalea sp.]
GNFVVHATSAEDIVYLACGLERILKSNISYYFSDGHATDNFTTFYDSSKKSDLPKIIDWDAIKTQYWGGAENLNLKRKKQAEFLISSDLSPEFLKGFVCSTEKTKSKLIEMGIEAEKIFVNKNCYY